VTVWRHRYGFIDSQVLCLHDYSLQHGSLRYTVTVCKVLQSEFGVQIDHEAKTLEVAVF
jgi:hypothetical protein